MSEIVTDSGADSALYYLDPRLGPCVVGREEIRPLSDDGPLAIRARWKRALRWPLILWRYRQTGVSWRLSWRVTHWVIWYQPLRSPHE